jgi:hypothetical protein
MGEKGEKFAANPVTGTGSMMAHNRGTSPNFRRPSEEEKLEHPYVLPQSLSETVVSLGVAGQATIRRSGSSRFRALERTA